MATLDDVINSKPIFTPADIGKIFEIGPDAVRARIRAGTIKAVKRGRRYYITRQELERLLTDDDGAAGADFGERCTAATAK